MTTRPVFQIKQFLVDNFGDADKEMAFLAGYGIVYQRQALHKQWIRESVPADLLPVLLALLEIEQGAPVSLAKWLR